METHTITPQATPAHTLGLARRILGREAQDGDTVIIDAPLPGWIRTYTNITLQQTRRGSFLYLVTLNDCRLEGLRCSMPTATPWGHWDGKVEAVDCTFDGVFAFKTQPGAGEITLTNCICAGGPNIAEIHSAVHLDGGSYTHNPAFPFWYGDGTLTLGDNVFINGVNVTPTSEESKRIPGDFTGDGVVDLADQLYVIEHWGDTDLGDLLEVVNNWGASA